MNSLPLWVAASFAAYLLFVNAAAYLRARYTLPQPRWLVGTLLGVWVRLAFFVLVPYAALIGGVGSPALYGLAPLAYDAAVQMALTHALALFVLVSLLLALHARLVPARYPAHVRPATRSRAQLSQPWGVAYLLVDVLCQQAHWAFYRAGMIVLLGDWLLGTLAGAALVAGEWLLDPMWRARVRAAGQAEEVLLTFVLLLFSAWLFVLTRNAWLLLLAHVVLLLGWLLLLQWWHQPRARADAVSAGAPDG